MRHDLPKTNLAVFPLIFASGGSKVEEAKLQAGYGIVQMEDEQEHE
jgi:hypothetical protein